MSRIVTNIKHLATWSWTDYRSAGVCGYRLDRCNMSLDLGGLDPNRWDLQPRIRDRKLRI